MQNTAQNKIIFAHALLIFNLYPFILVETKIINYNWLFNLFIKTAASVGVFWLVLISAGLTSP